VLRRVLRPAKDVHEVDGCSGRRKTSTRSMGSSISANVWTHGTPSTSSQSAGRTGITR
jgi:hypothetical protein